MKVCIVTHFHRGGIVHYVTHLANSLAEKADVELVTFKKAFPRFLYPGKTLSEPTSISLRRGIQVHRLLVYYDPSSCFKAALAMKQEVKPDVVHVQWMTPFLNPMLLLVMILVRICLKRPIVITCHNVEPHESGFIQLISHRLLSRYMYRLVNSIIVHAEENRRRLTFLFPQETRGKIRVIPHGGYSAFAFNVKEIDELEAKRALSLDQREIVLFFGFIRPYKGLEYLIEAMKKVVKEVPQALLLVAGEPWEPLERYQKIVRQSRLETSVRFHPYYIPDSMIPYFFAAADVVVLPYLRLSQSGIVQIAFAFGKPVVATAVGGIPELIASGENGVLVPPEDRTALEEAIIYLLKNKNFASRLGQNGRASAAKTAWSKIAQATLDAYSQTLKDSI